MRAMGGNDMWPKYTRWDVIIQPAAEGPITVTLEAGAGADAYGNENTAPDSALEVIAANPVTVEVNRTNSGFAEGGKAAFMVTRSRDNGAIPVSLSLDQTGDFLSGAVEVYPPPDPNNPDEPVTPQEVTFTETPVQPERNLRGRRDQQAHCPPDRGRLQGRGRRHGHAVGSRPTRPVQVHTGPCLLGVR